ncbi:MAG: UDPglucose--hexose-phosphate uridylyltransferase [Chthoniobacter sp.]|jgi:UDPglucose--hexose-1-phosphate uridylyltransferase|nr:UDPglucose--hexose-phosphate uridylyltransferase [Chthoniobacter sp.]
MSEIRHNRLTGEWVVIAPERANRGGNLARPPAPTSIPAFVPSCPFCPGNEALTPDEQYRVDGDDGHWALRSIVNKFSVLSATGEVAVAGSSTSGGDTVNGVGLHEVLIESPQHHLTTALFSIEQVQRILEAYRHRFQAFYADPRIQHVIVFKNHGADAGASQQHPHSQIVGLPIVPQQIGERLETARRFFAETGRCPACTLLAQEQEHRCRIVAENAAFVAFIPYAALSPYHLWIFPKVHAACFSELPVEMLPALAEIIRTVLAKLYGLLANPAFNLVVRSLGPREKEAPHFHWYLSIVARVNKVAGFELGTGMFVNPSSPEVCAQALREFAGP